MAATSEERERQAERELGHTEIGRGLSLALVALFLATLLSVPAAQVGGRWPDVGALLEGIPDECELRRFERAVEDDSEAGRWLLPRLQVLLTGALRVGNEQVYLGAEGWLYHRAGVDYATGPGFLEPKVQEARRRSADACEPAPEPDAVAALAGFHEELAARGIRLLLLPTPVKAVGAPERLARGRAGPLQNPSFAAFVSDLEARGVAVLDPTPLLLEPGSYLDTDTHWRPEAMERVARALAERIEATAGLAPPERAAYARGEREVRHFGDLVLMLNLPAVQALYAPESVTIRPVREGGGPWRPRRGAPVLLLGDSFSNVYSDAAAFRSERAGEGSDWGEGAGLAEQLSYALGRPVDRIVRNAGGAHAARSDLAREAAREAEAGRDRLAGVRVVVWQFAVRELAQGDWRAVPLPPPPARSAPAAHAAPAPAAQPPRAAEEALAGASRIRAALVARAEPPRPGSVPYRDALIALHLRGVETLEGGAVPGEILVYTWGMRDDAWTDAARLAPGARVELRVEPFESETAQARAGSLNRVELDDLGLLALPAFLGEPAPAGGAAP
jgi:alginate O-acetyltransferase complex protein AlgJ